MKTLLSETPGGPATLVLREVPEPSPGPGQLRIAVRACGINYPDVLLIEDKYQVRPPRPFAPGLEVSGVVDALGDGVTGFAVGDRVIGHLASGGLAEKALAVARDCLPIGATMPFDVAAGLLVTYGTSQHALKDRADLRAGETLLVLGAAGGVGSAAVQIAKAAGAKVIAAASSDEKCAFCRRLGADGAINYSRENLRDALKALTGGRGPDVVYDPVGGDLAEPAFRAIAWRGRYLVIGFAQGGIPALPFNLPLLKGAAIVGVFWGEFVRREPKGFARDMAQLVRWHAEGRVKPAIDRRLPMRELPAAYARMAERGVMGKLLLVNE
jgi:NADPH2:quinone reductase